MAECLLALALALRQDPAILKRAFSHKFCWHSKSAAFGTRHRRVVKAAVHRLEISQRPSTPARVRGGESGLAGCKRLSGRYSACWALIEAAPRKSHLRSDNSALGIRGASLRRPGE
jgi:hypothetical protein